MGKTKYGHETIELIVTDSEKYPKEKMEKHYPISYNRSEYDYQIQKMKKLGINVNEQTFEQCVNTLLYLYENKIY
jgi:hypothetical protein